MTALAIALLIIIIAVTTVGVFSCWYKDTLLQCLGLITTCLASCALLIRIYYSDYVSHVLLTFIFGVALYFMGTFWKHYKKTKPIRKRYARGNH